MVESLTISKTDTGLVADRGSTAAEYQAFQNGSTTSARKQLVGDERLHEAYYQQQKLGHQSYRDEFITDVKHLASVALNPANWWKFVKQHWAGFLVIGVLSLALLFLGIFAFDPLGWKGWVSFAIIVLALGILVESLLPTEVVFLLAGTAFMAFQILSVKEALAGFSNEGIATVAVLFIVAEGIQRTNVLNVVFRFLLGRPTNVRVAVIRMIIPCVLLSSFLNNTPIVAMMIPVIMRWSEFANIPYRTLLMPMTIAVTLAAQNTVIGTSTNLVVTGLVESNKLKDLNGQPVEIPIFLQTKAAVIYCAVGCLYLVIASPFLLKPKKALTEEEQDIENQVQIAEQAKLKVYTILLSIDKSFPSRGRSLKEAGFASQTLFVPQLIRLDGTELTTPDGSTIVETGDTILVSGPLNLIVGLYKLDGLSVATSSSLSLPVKRHRRSLYEVVLGPGFQEAGAKFGDSKWEHVYEGAVVGVQTIAGDGRNLNINDIPLEQGVAVLVEGGDNFAKSYRYTADFSVIYPLHDSQAFRTDPFHMIFASAVAITAIALAAAEVVSLFITASVASFLLIAFRCITIKQAGEAVDMPVVLTVASTFSLSTALDTSGAAAQLSQQLVKLFSPWGSYGLLFGIYLSTSLLTQIITNNGAAALMFPIALSPKTGVAYLNKLNPYAAIFTLMFGASSCFSTPFGYQCNMMVHTPGRYSFNDWPRHSFVLQVILAFLAPALTNLFWPS